VRSSVVPFFFKEVLMCMGTVNTMKQASAFPPNFIHILDATHRMSTAIECRVQGLTFASVHDSYWTHACSIDHMSEIIRDTFIALHSSDVLQKLEAEVRSVLPPIPSHI
jgi:DNA-directed RNA polymerase